MLLERLKQFIDYKGIAISAFEKSIGMSNASFGKSLKNGGTIGADKLGNILQTYPEVNLYWLITGVGEMLKSDQPENPMGEQPEPDTSLVEYLKRKVAELEGKVEKLTDEKADLLQQNAVLKYENQLLTPQKGRKAEDAESFLSASAAQ